MKISYNWLKQYIDLDIDIPRLSRFLTDCGLEVEALNKVQSVKGGLKGVVIGEVKTKKKHPNAEHLSITTVDIGKKELLKIVCGAPNVQVGQKVPVATIGTTLYQGDNSFKIKKSKLRGELSEGMICAEDELGLGSSHNGIMVLDPSVKPGTSAKDYFKIEDDYIFDIGLTPNRTDAMSHIGVARDLIAVLNNLNPDKENIPKKTKKLIIPSVKDFKIDNHDREIKVIVENINDCPRYSGLTISGIEVKESPDWLKNRLKSIDVRPINNIVDITNFVLFETGQPLHAFDADKIKGSKVIVKNLEQGSKFISLDEVERELSKEDLMICNSEEGMCIAGIFGGAKSGVTYKTKNVFLESAYFNSKTIRKTSKRLGLKTEASFRFERGTDPEMTIYALKRAALLIKNITGGKISSDIIDVYPKPVEKKKINISYKNINRLIGKSIDKKIIKNILKSLEIKILNETDEGLILSIPTYRVDVTREADIVEEILRIYGFNNIDIPSQVKSSLTFSLKPNKNKIENSISDLLSSNGFFEIYNNSLTKSAYSEIANIYKSENNVKILNPLSKDLNVLRQTLLFGGLESIIHNLNRKITDLKFYEFGNTYHLISEKSSNENILSKYLEVKHLTIFITGRKYPENWNTTNEKVDFFYIKALVNNILKRLGIYYSNLKTEINHSEIFDESLVYNFKKTKLVEFGLLRKKLLKLFDIKQEVYYSDLNWDSSIKLIKNNEINYKEIPKFPEVRRDLALLIDKNIQFADIKELAFKTEKYLLKSVNLFDVYKGDKIEAGKKSYALSFILQNPNKTLTDKVIGKTMNKLIKAYKQEFKAVIR